MARFAVVLGMLLCAALIASGEVCMDVHVVGKGDTLGQIADSYGVSVDEIVSANSFITDPDSALRAEKINIPPCGMSLRRMLAEVAAKSPSKAPAAAPKAATPAKAPAPSLSG